MNRVVPLVETPLLRISRFEHPEEEPHRDPREERSTSVSFSFVLSGSFSIRAGSRQVAVTPRTIFATLPGLPYRITHEEECPKDVCLSVDYLPEFFGKESSFDSASPVLALTNRTAYLKWRLLRALDGRRDGAAFEEIGADLAEAVLTEPGPGGKLFREKSLAWYAERVEAARARLEVSFHERHSLGSLSRSAGMSPFHFSRVFRLLVGTPPGRYLLRTRLERAHRMLRHGRTVTDVSFDCGFRNLSYFTRAFRKRYRVPPSAVRPK